MSRSLDGNGQSALVLGTGTGLAPGPDFAAVSQKSAQGWDVFVVDDFGLVQAKGAHFAASLKTSPASESASALGAASAPLVSATLLRPLPRRWGLVLPRGG